MNNNNKYVCAIILLSRQSVSNLVNKRAIGRNRVLYGLMTDRYEDVLPE